MHGDSGFGAAERDARDAADAFACIRPEVVEVRLGPGLAAALLGAGPGSPEAEATLDAVHEVRRAIARETGIVFGGSHWTDRGVRAYDYEIFVRRRRFGYGALAPDDLLASGAAERLAEIAGEATVDPVYGGPAKRISAGDGPDARRRGATVSDARDLVCAHLARIVRERTASIFGFQEFSALLRWTKRIAPAVSALIGEEDGRMPKLIAYAAVRAVLREAIPLRNPILALEAAATAHRDGRDPAVALRARLVPAYLSGPRARRLGLVALDPELVRRVCVDRITDAAAEARLRAAISASRAPAAAGATCAPADRAALAAWAAVRDLGVPVFAADEVPADVRVRAYAEGSAPDGARVAAELQRFVSVHPLRPSPTSIDGEQTELTRAAFEAVDIGAVAAALERELADRFLGTHVSSDVRNVADARARRRPETCFADIETEALTISLGVELLGAFLGTQAAAETSRGRLHDMRCEIARETGVVVPSIRFRPDADLAPDEYAVSVEGRRAAHARLRPGRFLIIALPSRPATFPGEETADPVYGLRAIWTDGETAERARAGGAAVFDALSVLMSHVGRVARDHAAESFGTEAFAALFTHLRKSAPALTAAIDASPVGTARAHEAYRALLREGVFADPVVVLEAFLEDAREGMDPDDLAECARKRTVPGRLADRPPTDGVLEVVGRDDLQDPANRDRTERLTAALRRRAAGSVEGASRAFASAVVVCDPEIRRYVRDAAAAAGIPVAVYARDELPDGLVYRTAETHVL